MSTVKRYIKYSDAKDEYTTITLVHIPGTEIKVTPESAVPIIPNATKYQGDFLFALKKVSLLLPDFLFMKYEKGPLVWPK